MKTHPPRVVSAEGVFDVAGNIVQIYEKFRYNAFVPDIVRTVDLSGFWDDTIKPHRICNLWKALMGDTAAAKEIAWWYDEINNDEGCLVRGEVRLAIDWYGVSAHGGDLIAMNNLANIYCSAEKPYWNGPLAVELREQASAAKLPQAMRGLAYCLECGNCCKWDESRARLLRAKADEIMGESTYAES